MVRSRLPQFGQGWPSGTSSSGVPQFVQVVTGKGYGTGNDRKGAVAVTLLVGYASPEFAILASDRMAPGSSLSVWGPNSSTA
jgi:hypothetical protein